jgi:hypothetical protein
MLALCHSSHQGVVTNEQLDSTDMSRAPLGNDEALRTRRDALAQRVMEALDVIGFAC